MLPLHTVPLDAGLLLKSHHKSLFFTENFIILRPLKPEVLSLDVVFQNCSFQQDSPLLNNELRLFIYKTSYQSAV